MRRWAKRLLVVAILGGTSLVAARLLRGDPYHGVVYQQDAVYGQADGVDLKLDLARPKTGDGPFPLIVLLHGGGWQWGDKAEYREALPRVARAGYVCAALNHRLAPAHRFPAQLDDVRVAIAFLCKNAARYAIDSDRVALFGGSAGGHLALLAGFTARDQEPAVKIRAIVSFAGPTDLGVLYVTVEGKDLVSDFLGTTDRKAKIAEEASPITHVKRDVPPVMTVHGDKDELVPVSQAIALHQALEQAGCTQDLMVIKGGGHSSLSWRDEDRTRAHMRAFEFIAEHLGAK